MTGERVATDPALGRLQGFLDAFARLNDKTDHSYSFEYHRLPQAATATDAVKAVFGADLKSLEVTPLIDWPQAARRVLRKWLFEFQCVRDDHLVDKYEAFLLSDEVGRVELLDDVLKMLIAVGHPTAVWQLNVETKRWYEGAWDDIVFETANGTYLLHLGVSD